MDTQFPELTGQDLLDGIKKKNKERVFMYICMAILGLLLAFGAIYYFFKDHDFLFVVLGPVIGLMITGFSIYSITKFIKVIHAPENCILFRKYGSPDTIAADITAGRMNTILAEKHTLLTDRYIMTFSDFESYVPFDKIMLVYKTEHSTNGIKDGVFLTVYDIFGAKFDYAFKMGKKNEPKMIEAIGMIKQANPECVVGYSPHNVSWVKSNAKKIPEI